MPEIPEKYYPKGKPDEDDDKKSASDEKPKVWITPDGEEVTKDEKGNVVPNMPNSR